MKLNRQKKWAMGGVLVLMLLLQVIQCEQIDDPLSVSEMRIARAGKLGDLYGRARDVFYRYETIYFSLDILYPLEQTDIQVIRLRDEKIVKRLVVISDEYGRIVNLPIWYYVGHEEPEENVEEGDYMVHVLQPGVNRPWKIFRLPFHLKDYKLPVFHLNITDAQGTYLCGSSLVGESISVIGRISGGRQEVKFWVVEARPQFEMYTEGMVYQDLSGDGVESVMTDDEGVFPLTG
ncbi:hypothetical protein JW992_10535, partial [candidate division KSB1 bacterium]|nr:hypothetical protein [candidate division KSB1 bacterium]